MRPKTLILFIVAIGCGLVASIGVSQYMESARGNGGVPLETMKVYVATTEVNIGEKLDDKNIRLEEWPKDRVPEGAITELKQLENMYTRARFYKGEPILSVKLSDSIDGNHEQTIPEGFRVLAVKVDAVTGGGGLIRPGNRVDVVVFLRKSAEVPQTETRTILRDVNVFAVEGETERAVDKGTGQSRDVRTISLLVKPKQAEALTLAKELGILSLTLRRPNEVNEEATDGETVRSLLGTDADNANDKKHSEGEESGLAKWLSQAATQIAAPPVQPVPVPTPVVEEPAKFVMKIRTPNGDREYRWKDLDGEPEEAGTSVNNHAPPLPGPAIQSVTAPAGIAPEPLTPVESTSEEPVSESLEPANEG